MARRANARNETYGWEGRADALDGMDGTDGTEGMDGRDGRMDGGEETA